MSKVKVGSTEKLQTVHLILDSRETQSHEVRSSFRFNVRHKGEDYGAFSSSCPGYGKHHSGDVEAAFSKFISCSLSSKGCKHR